MAKPCFPLPALSREASSVTDGERGIFTATEAPRSEAGDFNTPHRPELPPVQLKDVGISDQPHSRSVLVLLLLNEVGFFSAFE